MSRTCLSFNVVKGKTIQTIPRPPSSRPPPVRAGTGSVVHNIKVNGNNVIKVMNPSKEQVLRNVMNHSNPNLSRGGGCGCGGK